MDVPLAIYSLSTATLSSNTLYLIAMAHDFPLLSHSPGLLVFCYPLL